MKIVKVDNTAQATASDVNAIGTLHRAALDYVVKNLLFDEARYVGYPVAGADAMNLTVGVGALITGGKVYDTAATTSLSVVSLLPTANRRVVLVVVSGEEVATDVETRKFLVDAATRTTQPKPTSTRVNRQAGVNLIAGAAAAVPARPAVPAGALVVASFELATTGIVAGSIEMEVANSAFSLEKTVASVAVLDANLKKTRSLLDTLRSDIAALAKELKKTATATEVTALTNRLGGAEKHISATESTMLRVLEHTGLPDVAAYQGFDSFATIDESDTAHPAYTAAVEGGRLRFGEIEKTKKFTALLNPNDPKVDKTTSGLIMPAGVDTLRLECDDKDAEVAIASYQVTTTEVKQKTLTRTYIWYASETGRAAQERWFAEHPVVRLYDPVTDTWDVIDLTQVKKWRFAGTGIKHTWKMYISTAYWEQGQVTKTFTGARLCQTFLVAQSGWHRRLDLGFTSIGETGDVHVKICALDEAGHPDFDEVLETATIPVADLQTWPKWTRVDFDPVWLEKGERYGIVVTTTGNHKLGMSTSDDLTNGTLMTWTSGSVWSTDLAKDLVFRLYGVRFASTRVIVDIADVTLAGGITEIQSVLTGYEPAGTALILQARINGVWRSVDESDATVLAGKPTQLPLRFLFQGTKDLMPALSLPKSAIIVSRPRPTSVHVSTVRTRPAGVTVDTVRIWEDAVGFDEATHDWTVKILTGAGFTTEHVATATGTETLANGRVARTWLATGLTGLTSYKIETTMTTSDASKVFDVLSRRDSIA